MSILVSNPSTVQFTGATAEPQDPAATPQNTGFTEELANAMQPLGQQADGATASQKLAVAATETKLIDLQILPADVLLNAVGEANFAFSAQGAPIAQVTDSTKAIAETGEQLAIQEALDPTQAAELAAAALAAQMASQPPAGTTNSQPGQISQALNSVGNADPSVLAGEFVSVQTNKLDLKAQESSQTSSITPQAAANLPVANPSGGAAISQVNVLSSGVQELQPNMTFLGEAKPALSLLPEGTPVAQMEVQAPKIVGGELQLNVVDSQQAQPKDSLNQIASNAVNTGQISLENSALNATTIQSNSSQTGITSTQNSVGVVSDGVSRIRSADNIPPLVNEQKSVFDLAQSDVARPGDEGSANPVQAGVVAHNEDSVQTNAQALVGLQITETSELHSDGSLQLKTAQTGEVLNGPVEKSIASKVENPTEESAFKFDAKLGAHAPNLEATGGSLSTAQPTKPASLGGAALGQTKPTSLGLSVEPVAIKESVQQSQVLVTTEAVVSQTRSAANGQELVVETALQTTIVTTLEKPSIRIGVGETSATTASIQAVNTSVSGQVVRQTENKSEIRVDDDVAFDYSSNLSSTLALSKTSNGTDQIEFSQPVALTNDKPALVSISPSQVNTNQLELSQPAALTNNIQAIAPINLSQVNTNQLELSQPAALTNNIQAIAPINLSQEVNGIVLSDIAVLENESNSETNQLSGTTSIGNIEPTKATRDSRVDSKNSDANQNSEVLNSNFINQQIVAESSQEALAQNELPQTASKGFEVVSSTFVNSLVGGPQRSMTTVMDWVALKPQESPRPVVPHELRLDAGAVQVEIQRMVKQGGGHVVMELTPPDQSKFTIELKLDEVGGAYLRVEGVSDSTKTRLEQSAPQLQEQFQEMGLNLQLDMRQNKDSSSSGTANWTPNEPGFDNAKPQEASAQTTRAVATERARNNNGGQVYLYA